MISTAYHWKKKFGGGGEEEDEEYYVMMLEILYIAQLSGK